MPADPDTTAIAKRVLEFIPANSVVGLGTGRAATAFIHALGEAVKKGLFGSRHSDVRRQREPCEATRYSAGDL